MRPFTYNMTFCFTTNTPPGAGLYDLIRAHVDESLARIRDPHAVEICPETVTVETIARSNGSDIDRRRCGVQWEVHGTAEVCVYGESVDEGPQLTEQTASEELAPRAQLDKASAERDAARNELARLRESHDEDIEIAVEVALNKFVDRVHLVNGGS